MSTTVWGVVKNGSIVPSAPLPEGSPVEIRLFDSPAEIPPELQEELEAWRRASANALVLVASAEKSKQQFASALEFLESLPRSPSPRCFPSWDEYERFLREEKEAWER
jgi:hypothetical protein